MQSVCCVVRACVCVWTAQSACVKIVITGFLFNLAFFSDARALSVTVVYSYVFVCVMASG